MSISTDMLDEMNVLMKFDLSTTLAGIKVHSDATPATIAASQRLFAKGLLTQADGGYLTSLGYEAAQHVQSAVMILREVKL
ncbi:TIGR02647 family protein [Cellvibrio sp. ARAG 10.3]|uniref:TIGR02647 family protein n=1 Tax=Cellvibrio sp. ARAG 10.3 TaxID=3451358 RepID=UPI003F46454B